MGYFENRRAGIKGPIEDKDWQRLVNQLRNAGIDRAVVIKMLVRAGCPSKFVELIRAESLYLEGAEGSATAEESQDPSTSG